MEGTGSYGVGLVRHLRKAEIPVFEVERPKRRHLRRDGKSDSRDAEAAAAGRCFRVRQQENPRAQTVGWR